MDTKNPFDTSFIPQQPVIKVESSARRGELNIPMVVALVLFFATLVAAGGLYLWRTSIEKRINDKETQLASKEGQIDIDKIKELERIEARLTTGKRLVENHAAFSALLEFLESETVKSVGYTKLTYQIKEGAPIVNIIGEAPSYMSVYVQEQSLRSHPSVGSVRAQKADLVPATGVIRFELEIVLDPRAMKYTEQFKRKTEMGSSTSTSPIPRETTVGGKTTNPESPEITIIPT